MLMKEYGVEDCVVSDLTKVDDVLTKIDDLLIEKNRKAISRSLSQAGEIQRERSKRTWEDIFNFINQK